MDTVSSAQVRSAKRTSLTTWEAACCLRLRHGQPGLHAGFASGCNIWSQKALSRERNASAQEVKQVAGSRAAASMPMGPADAKGAQRDIWDSAALQQHGRAMQHAAVVLGSDNRLAQYKSNNQATSRSGECREKLEESAVLRR